MRALASDVDILSIYDWKDGQFTNQADERILRAAAGEGRVLVTFDVRTVPPVLVDFAACGEDHGGVHLVSVESFPQNDLESLGKAIAGVAAQHRESSRLPDFPQPSPATLYSATVVSLS